MQKLILICTYFTVFLFITLPSWAQGGNEKTVHILASYSVPPYIITDGAHGLAAEIVIGAFKLKGYKVDFSYTTNYRIQRELLTKKADAAFNFPIEPKIHSLYYSSPIVNYRNVIVARSDDNLEINSLEDLIGKNVVAFANASNFLGDHFNNIMKKAKSYREIQSKQEQVIDLYNKKADVLIVDHAIFEYTLKYPTSELDVDLSYRIFPIFKSSPRPVTFHSKRLRDIFEAGLKSFEKTKEYRDIRDKYKGVGY